MAFSPMANTTKPFKPRQGKGGANRMIVHNEMKIPKSINPENPNSDKYIPTVG